MSKENKNTQFSLNQDPLIVWMAFTFAITIIIGLTLLKPFITGLSTDTSHISLVIVASFFLSFSYSYFVAKGLKNEWTGINRLTSGELPSSFGSDAESLAMAIRSNANRASLNVRDLVDSYFSRHEVPLRTISVLSSLMVTMGLIGTILGLIVSVGGLENIMKNVGGANSSLLAGVQETIRGMAIAFYSTLFGAILGAIVLRLLSINLGNTLIRMSCRLFEYLEMREAEYTSIDEAALASATNHFQSLAKVVAEAERELKRFTSTTLDSRLGSIEKQLEAAVSALRDIKK